MSLALCGAGTHPEPYAKVHHYYSSSKTLPCLCKYSSKSRLGASLEERKIIIKLEGLRYLAGTGVV